VDIDGIQRSVNEGDIGDLWLGSGVGPTFDGRLGVDVSAPGDRLVTTYGPTSYNATFRFNLIQGGNGVYGIFSAVSGASPIVTGIVALMLELKPDLDAVQVKQILQQSARSDNFTGTTPNTHWGYGKVDALNALTLVSQLVSVEKEDGSIPQNYNLSQNYPNPFNPNTNIKFSIPQTSFVTLEVFNALGESVDVLFSEELNAGSYNYDWNASNLTSGIYFYRLQTAEFVETKKMTLMK
jgi:subtilisin family serine protease